MQMLYNSDSYVVVQFNVPDDTEGGNGQDGRQDGSRAAGADLAAGDSAAADTAQPLSSAATARGGYEIVDKMARKEIYLQGALAQSFQRGVKALAEQNPNEEAIDDFIAGFTVLAQQPLLLH